MINYISIAMGNERLAEYELVHNDLVAAELRARFRAFFRDELADHPENLACIERIEVLHGPPASTILGEP